MMRKRILFAFLGAWFVAGAAAQDETLPVDFSDVPMGDIAQEGRMEPGLLSTGENQFTTAFGLALIDDQTYVAIRLQPDVSFGKFGLGLDIPLMVSLDDGSFRTEEFTDGVGVARVVRYLRWGQKKRDPLYIKVGDISGATLGFGLAMFQYSNVASFEKRPIGGEVDVNIEQKFGVEGVVSHFDEARVFGVRPYVRPLRAANVPLPIVRNVELGVLYVTDRAGYQGPVVDGEADPVSMWGADIGLPIRLTRMVQVVPYAAYTNFSNPEDLDPGSGAAIGINAQFAFIANVFTLSAKLERRFYGERFAGSFFDAIYEASRLSEAAPVQRLLNAEGDNSTVGSLYGHVINKVLIGGTLILPDRVRYDDMGNVVNGSYLRLDASAPDLIPRVVVGASYTRNYIADLGDAIKFDEQSSAFARLAYKVKPFLLVGADYRWTFAVVDEDGTEQLKATSYVFPFVALQFNLNFGQ